MEIQVKSDSYEAGQTIAQRLVKQNADFSPAVDLGKVKGRFVHTISVKGKLEEGK